MKVTKIVRANIKNIEIKPSKPLTGIVDKNLDKALRCEVTEFMGVCSRVQSVTLAVSNGH